MFEVFTTKCSKDCDYEFTFGEKPEVDTPVVCPKCGSKKTIKATQSKTTPKESES